MQNTKAKNGNKKKVKKERMSIIDFLYTKLLRDPSTNIIIMLVSFVFIIWMVVPLVLVLSGAIYLPGAEPINHYFFGSVNANQVGNETIFYNFILPDDTPRVKIVLQVPKNADFDLSVWNEEHMRTGGRTLDLSTGEINATEEENIVNSDYAGMNSNMETITVKPPLTFGNWTVGCYALSGEGDFQITVNIKSSEGGRFSFQSIVSVFTGTDFFNPAGDDQTQFYSKDDIEWGGPAYSIAVADNFAFVAERSEGIERLDVSNPREIVEIGQYYDEDGNASYYDLKTKDSLLYAASGQNGMSIFNISDVENDFTLLYEMVGFSHVSTFETSFIRIVDDMVYLDRNKRGFSIIDVSDITNPIILANVTMDTISESIAIADSYAYVVGYSTGIAVYNVSDGSNPILEAQYDPVLSGLGEIRGHDIEIIDDLAYIAKDNGFGIYNVSDPLAITLVNETTELLVDTRSYSFKSRKVEIHGSTAYLATETTRLGIQNYGLTILNIEDLDNMQIIDESLEILYKTEDIFLDVTNNLVFLAQLGGGIHILDSSNIYDLGSLDVYDDTQEVTVHTFSGVDRGVVLNTIILGLATTVASILLGTALAFILARYEFPGKRLFSVLALAPLIIPPFISGMGFRLLLGPEGFLNNLFLVPVFGSKIILTGFIAICYVQTSHFYALIYLNAFSSFINIDPSMEEQAENLGASSFRLFFTVTLPLAMPGIGAGSILVLILSMEDVGTPIIFAGMGDNEAKNYLTYYVFENIQKAGQVQVDPITMVLGSLLLFVALIGFFLIRKYVALRKYAMISKGRAGAYRLTKARWKLLFMYPYLIILFALSLLVHVGVFLMSILESLGPRSAADIKFTMAFYAAIFSPKSTLAKLYNVTPYIVNTLLYSIAATVVIVLLGSLAAYVISRKDFKGKGILDALVTIPIAIPGIALAIGYYRTFDWSGIASSNPTKFNIFMANVTESLHLDPFVGVAFILLIMSYTIRKFPFTVRSAFAGLQQTDVVLEEASFNLGAGRVRTFGKITIPLISLNVFAGSLVSFLYCLSEVSTTIFLIFQAEAGTITWFMAWNPLRFQIFCALGVLLMLLQILSLFITNVILGSRAEAITGI